MKPLKALLSALILLCVTAVGHAQPAFAGAFRGKLPNGSDILISGGQADSGYIGSLYVLNYITHTLDVTVFRPNANGTFNFYSRMGYNCTGTFVVGAASLSGTYAGSNFSIARISPYGVTQSLSGGYSGYVNDTSRQVVSSLNILASNQGEAFFISASGQGYDAGVGTLDAAGNFNVPTLGGDRLTGRLNVADGSATGTVYSSYYGALTYGATKTVNGVLENISTRGFVGTGDSVMIAGFVVSDFTKSVIVRVLGPTLQRYGVTNVLADPVFDVVNLAGVTVATNDNWASASAATRIPAASGLTYSGAYQIDAKEAGLLLNLDPGPYTVVVRGAAGTGNALVEVYEVR